MSNQREAVKPTPFILKKVTNISHACSGCLTGKALLIRLRNSLGLCTVLARQPRESQPAEPLYNWSTMMEFVERVGPVMERNANSRLTLDEIMSKIDDRVFEPESGDPERSRSREIHEMQLQELLRMRVASWAERDVPRNL